VQKQQQPLAKDVLNKPFCGDDWLDLIDQDKEGYAEDGDDDDEDDELGDLLSSCQRKLNSLVSSAYQDTPSRTLKKRRVEFQRQPSNNNNIVTHTQKQPDTPLDTADTRLSFVAQRYVSPAIVHLKTQVAKKREPQLIVQPHLNVQRRQSNFYSSETEKRMNWMQQIIDNLDLFFPPDKPRTVVQKTCHYWYLQTLFPWVFGAQWDVVKGRILKRYRLNRIWPWVQVLMPRREGKTWSVASFLAAVLMFIPGISVSIFSPTAGQSNMMKEEVYRMMVHYEQNTGHEATRRLVRYNSRHIMVADRPLPPGSSMKSSAADAMVLETNTSRLMLCNSHTDGRSRRMRYFACVYGW
jgi:hypothetical protein